jgi:NAD(P)H-hydrate repair Nnr-like enzyme with NAD(P)H-hydrate dehydratase domain
MTGAANLVGMSSLRSGAGLVTVGFQMRLSDRDQARSELMVRPLPSTPRDSFAPELSEICGFAPRKPCWRAVRGYLSAFPRKK